MNCLREGFTWSDKADSQGEREGGLPREEMTTLRNQQFDSVPGSWFLLGLGEGKGRGILASSCCPCKRGPFQSRDNPNTLLIMMIPEDRVCLPGLGSCVAGQRNVVWKGDRANPCGHVLLMTKTKKKPAQPEDNASPLVLFISRAPTPSLWFLRTTFSRLVSCGWTTRNPAELF